MKTRIIYLSCLLFLWIDYGLTASSPNKIIFTSQEIGSEPEEMSSIRPCPHTSGARTGYDADGKIHRKRIRRYFYN